MSITKNPLIRYKILDNCFRNTGRRYFIEDLIAECNKMLLDIDPQSKGISRRQIFDDISFMQSSEGWGVDLEKLRDGKRVYYQYADPSYSINNMPLNDVEIQQLESAMSILQQFKGMPQFEWVSELIPKLRQGMQGEEASEVIMEFESNEFASGIEHISTIFNAILYKKVLTISYQPFEVDSPYELTLHPYYLKQYNNRWFLFGHNPEKEKYDWNLALDRIKEIKESSAKFIVNTEIDWREYFEDIIGVTKPVGGLIENVKLVFYGKTAKYINTKPLHGSQKPPKWIDNETLEINLSLILNYEFERLILSYADSVKVIQPIHFANRINERHRKALEVNVKPKIE
jgi:predicted DNA-binding transcriptional regulator YafY